MDFSNQIGKGVPGFLLSSYIVTELHKYARGCVSLKKKKSQGKAVEVTVKSKEGLSDFCLDFVEEFGLWIKQTGIFCVDIVCYRVCVSQLSTSQSRVVSTLS